MRVSIDKVLSVYSGIDGKCCCGCSGKHSYSESTRKLASKDRGYEVTDDEINEKMVNKVMKIINEAESVEYGGNNISTVVGQRLYIVYLKPGA